jgi:hypothetical protein
MPPDDTEGGDPMTLMIRTSSGDLVHPLDHVQRRRWRPPAPPRSFDPTGAYAPGAELPTDLV